MNDHNATLIGAYDAKTKLPEILRRVEQGESFTVTNRGKAVADIVPTRQGKQSSVSAAIDALLSTQKPTASRQDLKTMTDIGRQ